MLGDRDQSHVMMIAATAMESNQNRYLMTRDSIASVVLLGAYEL
jgi:hypothetical protein